MKGLYYRRKLLLALLQEFGGHLSNLDYQKYLFLFSQEQEKKYFDFVPYKFGCFSFQSYADKSALAYYKYLKDGNGWTLQKQDKNFIKELTYDDQESLKKLKTQYKNLRGNNLVKYIYKKYPYYAINSEIASQLLSSEELKNIGTFRPKSKLIGLFTIGYEGRSIENYLNELLKNDIKLLCDVRKNPISRKYGFSKSQLKEITNKLGIKYLHIPELGINSKLRQNLETLHDYKELFKIYKLSTLPKQKEKLSFIINLIEKEKRVAITCFEAEPHMCHRSCLASALEKMPEWSYKVTNL